jgi:hypothetical protein
LETNNFESEDSSDFYIETEFESGSFFTEPGSLRRGSDILTKTGYNLFLFPGSFILRSEKVSLSSFLGSLSIVSDVFPKLGCFIGFNISFSGEVV